MNVKKIKSILSTKTVGIAGCGGLGSNCAAALARIGIGKLVIADFDVIDASNLNRQYYFWEQIGQQKVFALADNIHYIDPMVEVIPHDLKLGPAEIISIFADCDVIVEAFDLAEMKQMIIETVGAEFPEKPLVIGNGMAGWGNSNSIKTEKVTENIYVCGDGVAEISEELPPLAPRVGIVAHMQANTVLSILLGNTNQEAL
jgi:sulfur carrier protein ThiS adenylyltransferase